MALPKIPAPTPFTVPSLEADPKYKELLARQVDLISRQAALNAERRTIDQALRADTTPDVHPGVAALLGDAEKPDSRASRRSRLTEVNRDLRTLELAIEVLRQRIATARTQASVAVCDLVRPEYSRRVAACARALEALAAARADYDELRNGLEANDIAWGYLGPVSLGFLGDPADGHIPRFLREAKAAGHVN